MLHFEVKGEGKTIVFIHGFMENSKIWRETISSFIETHQIVTIDLAGHGKSKQSREINTIEDMADEVIEVLDYLQITSATFVGHSMGGYVNLALAEVYPHYVDKLVFVNSTSLPDSKEKKEQRLKVIPTVHKNFPLFVRLSIPMLFSEELKPNLQSEMEELKSIALETSIEGVEASLKGMRDRPDRTSVLYDADYPILIINGNKDETINVELFETVIPNKENINVVKLNCGHVAFMEQKEEFTETLLSFI